MNLILDTNIILDVLQKRVPHYLSSQKIWRFCENKNVVGYISTLTFANLIYVLRKNTTPNDIESIYQILAGIFVFADLTEQHISTATHLHWKDFEDALQYATAVEVKADYIITRNKKDFEGSDIPCLTPSDFCDLFVD